MMKAVAPAMLTPVIPVNARGQDMPGRGRFEDALDGVAAGRGLADAGDPGSPAPDEAGDVIGELANIETGSDDEIPGGLNNDPAIEMLALASDPAAPDPSQAEGGEDGQPEDFAVLRRIRNSLSTVLAMQSAIPPAAGDPAPTAPDKSAGSALDRPSEAPGPAETSGEAQQGPAIVPPAPTASTPMPHSLAGTAGQAETGRRGRADAQPAEARQSAAPAMPGRLEEPSLATPVRPAARGDVAGSGESRRFLSLPVPRSEEQGQGRVTLLSAQTIPAPAPAPAPGANVAEIVSAIAASPLGRSFGTALAPSRLQPVQILKIQLQPAELGSVTASLRASGERMSVELQVETHEAFRRLQADSEAISKSLRALGYEVEQVTVLQPAASGSMRADGPAPASRDPSTALSAGGSGSGAGDGPGDRAEGQRQHGHARNDREAQPLGRDRSGGGIYI